MFKLITKEKIYYIKLDNISTVDVTNKCISFKKDTLYYSIDNIQNIDELIKQITREI